MDDLFDIGSNTKRYSNLPEPPQSEEEIFHSFIDSINNAIGNKAKYDLNNEEDKEKFIDDYLEEFIFCLYNDDTFYIELLEIDKEFIISKHDGSYFYKVKDIPNETMVSETNRSEIQKIFKNKSNGCACIYIYRPADYKPIYLINFAYANDIKEKEIVLYKKVIRDYIELKEIYSLEALRKVIISSFKTYKKKKGEN